MCDDMQISETISTTELLNLNDYCLDGIFVHLNVIDLCSVTRVCTRLNQLAEQHFKRKLSKFDFLTSASELISSREASDVLRNFGHIMKSVAIPSRKFDNHNTDSLEELLKDIVEYCGESLHTLSLQESYFTSNAVDVLNMLSKSLESLSLIACDLAADCVFYLSNFSSLTGLAITQTHNCNALMGSFPALEYFELYGVSIPSESMLQHFIVTHKQLKTLKLRGCDRFSSNVFRSIGKYMKNLETLYFAGNLIGGSESIQQIQNNILYLGELKNLHTLVWYCDRLSIGHLLAKIVSNKIGMKVLCFGDCVVDDETISAIKKIKTLERLECCQAEGLKNKHLIEIAQEVTQMKKLCIGWQENITFDFLKKFLRHTKELHCLRIGSIRYPLDVTMYNDILNIVRKRENGIKLTITIDSDDVQNLIPQQTIDMNKNWLIIEREPFFKRNF